MIITLLILALLALYAFVGWRQGFWEQLADLVILIISFALALALASPLGSLLNMSGLLSIEMWRFIAFFIIWIGTEALGTLIWRRIRVHVPPLNQATRTLGIFPALVRGFILLCVVAQIVLTAPVADAVKADVEANPLAKPAIAVSTALSPTFDSLFGGALQQFVKLRTVKTEPGESLTLGFSVANPTVCAADEEAMLALVNKERTANGLRPVQADSELRDVGRAHSKDMFARGYFAHDTPDGLTPFDRMDAAGIKYQLAGENIALAPNVDVAHEGLMNSPGHRANILKPEYRRLGIGCMNGGARGKMFSQEFAG